MIRLKQILKILMFRLFSEVGKEFSILEYEAGSVVGIEDGLKIVIVEGASVFGNEIDKEFIRGDIYRLVDKTW